MALNKERLDPLDSATGKNQAFIHIQRYQYAKKEVSGLVLDIGCGFGYGSKILNKNSSVVSIDISGNALLYAKSKYPGPSYLRGDAQILPFKDACFDSIVAFEVIEHVDNGTNLLKEIYRVLKKGGILILSSPNALLLNKIRHLISSNDMKKPENPYHKHEYTFKELVLLLKSTRFVIEETWGQVLPLPFVFKLPLSLYINTGRLLPRHSVYAVYKARKTNNKSHFLPRTQL